MTGIKASDLTPEQKLEGYRQILDELITEKLVNKAAAYLLVRPEGSQASPFNCRRDYFVEDAIEVNLNGTRKRIGFRAERHQHETDV